MTHEAILEKLNEIFQDIFDDDSLVITETTTANDVEDGTALSISIDRRCGKRNSNEVRCRKPSMKT
ncbi:MAG: hypothetical protein ACLR5S_09610 [Ruminococcus sp.]